MTYKENTNKKVREISTPQQLHSPQEEYTKTHIQHKIKYKTRNTDIKEITKQQTIK